MRNLRTMGKTALFVSAFLWGMGYVALESALLAGWHPIAILTMTGGIGGCTLFAFSYKRKWWRNKAMIFQGMFAGLFLSLGMLSQAFGQQLSSPTNAAIIITSYVIFTPIIYSFKHRRPLSTLVLGAAIISFFGVLIISYEGSLLLNPGDVILVVGALMFSFHFIQLESIAHFDDSLSLATIQLFTMSLLSGVMMPLVRIPIQSEGFVFIAYLGLVSSGLAFFLQNYGQKLVTSSSASVIMTFEAIFGVIASIVFFKEYLSFRLFIGAFLLIGSVFILEIMPHSRYFKGRRY